MGQGRNERQDVTLGGRFTMTVEDSQLVLFINTQGKRGNFGYLDTDYVGYTSEKGFSHMFSVIWMPVNGFLNESLVLSFSRNRCKCI